MAKNNEIKPIATFGDIVTVKGYGNRVFMVEEFTVEYQHHPDGKITPSVIYDLTCPFTFDYIIGEQADITVVCKAATAHMYISQIEPYTPDAPVDYEIKSPANYENPKISEWEFKLEVITPADVKPKRQSKRQKQAEIDGLLDELITMQTVIDICGSDEDYAVRIADVKRKLKEASV
jgi:hypothetical protein